MEGLTPSCFDVFAGLWVYLYERYVPSAQREAQQGYLLDELQSTTQRLRSRRDDLHTRLQQHVLDAKRILSRGDRRMFKAKMVSARRLRLQVCVKTWMRAWMPLCVCACVCPSHPRRAQVDRIDSSLSTIENNIDEIINSDVTRDIIDSLRRSTEALKGQAVPMGGVEGVQEIVDELQTELMASQEVTDTIYKGMSSSLTGMVDADDDDSLLLELNSMLREEGEEEVPLDPSLTSLLSTEDMPSVPLLQPLLLRRRGDQVNEHQGTGGGQPPPPPEPHPMLV
jgi:hypothetical protein